MTGYPSWLAPPVPAPVAGSPGRHRKIKQGKPAPAAQKRPQPRKGFMSAFMWQLDKALAARVEELWCLDQENYFPVTTYRLVRALFDAVYAHLAWLHSSPDASARQIYEGAQSLLVPLAVFKLAAEQKLPPNEQGLMLASVLNDLAEDVQHYALQIAMCNGIVNTVPAKGKPGFCRPLIPNRPTKNKTWERYVELVAQHQATHGPGSSPKPKAIKAQLEAEGHDISDRTLRGWKSQL